MKIKYIADDGIEFDNEELCIKYERDKNSKSLKGVVDKVIALYHKLVNDAYMMFTEEDEKTIRYELNHYPIEKFVVINLSGSSHRLFVRKEIVDILIERIKELENEK